MTSWSLSCSGSLRTCKQTSNGILDWAVTTHKAKGSYKQCLMMGRTALIQWTQPRTLWSLHAILMPIWVPTSTWVGDLIWGLDLPGRWSWKDLQIYEPNLRNEGFWNRSLLHDYVRRKCPWKILHWHSNWSLWLAFFLPYWWARSLVSWRYRGYSHSCGLEMEPLINLAHYEQRFSSVRDQIWSQELSDLEIVKAFHG